MSLLGLLTLDRYIALRNTAGQSSAVAQRQPPASSQPQAQRGPTQPPREKYVEVIASADPEELSRYAEQWEALVVRALEPNAFYEHWMLLPALRHYADERVQIVMVLERDPNAGMSSKMIGLFPLEKCPRFHGLPASGMGTWRHPHCYLCTPLIDRDHDQACWEAVLNWLRDDPDTGHFLDLRTIRGDGPLMQSFQTHAFARRMPFYVGEYYGRAMLDLTTCATGEQYLQANMGGDHRRGYARKKRQLAQKGELCVRTLREGDNLQTWMDDFLKLEASGWKGEAATAMACNQTDRAFFATVCGEAHRRNRLMMMELTLNGTPIAGHMGINAGDGSYAIKIAYDEGRGPHSPGVLLEIEAIHELHRAGSCRWVDCCSAWNGEAMQRVWKQQRAIASVICPTGKVGGRPVVAALPLMRYLRGRIGTFLSHRPAA